MLKRQMFGRAHLDLLSRRFLRRHVGAEATGPRGSTGPTQSQRRPRPRQGEAWLLMTPGVPPLCRGRREGVAGHSQAVQTRGVPARRLSREGSTCPLQRTGHALHTLSLRLSPKWPLNPKNVPKRTNCLVHQKRVRTQPLWRQERRGCLWESPAASPLLDAVLARRAHLGGPAVWRILVLLRLSPGGSRIFIGSRKERQTCMCYPVHSGCVLVWRWASSLAFWASGAGSC